MPTIQWRALPRRVKEHLRDRSRVRGVTADDLNTLLVWIGLDPDVPVVHPEHRVTSVPILCAVVDMQDFHGASFHRIDHDVRGRRKCQLSCAASVAKSAPVGRGLRERIRR